MYNLNLFMHPAKYSIGFSFANMMYVSTHPEEIVEVKDIEISLILDIQKSEEILQSLWLFPVLQCENKIQVGLVILKK